MRGVLCARRTKKLFVSHHCYSKVGFFMHNVRHLVSHHRFFKF